jgi:hypothetical protein
MIVLIINNYVLCAVHIMIIFASEERGGRHSLAGTTEEGASGDG